jgi:hypothetical protein
MALLLNISSEGLKIVGEMQDTKFHKLPGHILRPLLSRLEYKDAQVNITLRWPSLPALQESDDQHRPLKKSS